MRPWQLTRVLRLYEHRGYVESQQGARGTGADGVLEKKIASSCGGGNPKQAKVCAGKRSEGAGEGYSNLIMKQG